jgi:hypothetical protein
MKSRTTEVGNASEAWVLAALIEAGYIVLQTFGDRCKYQRVLGLKTHVIANGGE